MENLTVLASTPPTCGVNCFYEVPVETCYLNVPVESVDLYSSTDPWSDFFNIQGMETSSISGLLEEGNDSFSIYQLNGIKLLDTSDKDVLKSLPKGIYIMVSGNERRKIVI